MIQIGALLDPETWNTMLREGIGLVPRLGAVLAVLLAFWIGAAVARGAVGRLGRLHRLDPDVTGLLAQSARIAILVFGVITALGTLGINVSALVAGLGLTSLALGLALKEVGSNAIAGVLVLLYKPFKRGDVIAVLAFQGRAAEIDLRYTTLDTPQGRVFVPNMLLLTNVMVVSPGASDALSQ